MFNQIKMLITLTTSFSIHTRDEQSTLNSIKWRLKTVYKEQDRKIRKKNAAEFHSQ